MNEENFKTVIFSFSFLQDITQMFIPLYLIHLFQNCTPHFLNWLIYCLFGYLFIFLLNLCMTNITWVNCIETIYFFIHFSSINHNMKLAQLVVIYWTNNS